MKTMSVMIERHSEIFMILGSSGMTSVVEWKLAQGASSTVEYFALTEASSAVSSFCSLHRDGR
jgi:hypothetical protein